MKLTFLFNYLVNTIKLNIIVAFLTIPLITKAQGSKSISLDSLQALAQEHYPYTRQLLLNGQYGDESVKAAGSSWLPQLSVSGKATLQSEVTAVSLPSNLHLGFTLDQGEKLQYQGELTLSQLIYDGGIIKTSKKINRLTADIQSGNTQTSMLQVESIIDNLFENIQIIREQLKMLDFQKEDLQARQKDLTAAVGNGMTLPSALQEFNAEISSVDQKRIESNAQLSDFYSQLSFFTQEKLDTSFILQWTPLVNDCGNDFSNRPDYQNFGKQIKSTDWQLKMLRNKEVPQLMFFATGYYGRPGINYMNYNDHFSGITGINFKWNFANLYSNTHEKKKLSIQRELIQEQQNIFNIEMNKQIEQINIDIAMNEQLLKKDDEVIKARTEVKKTAAVQLESGAITTADYIQKLDAESLALANREIHKIRWQMGYVKKATLVNKNINQK